MLSSVSDIDLWNVAIEGNREALGLLFRRHYPMLYQYGSKICSDTNVLEDAIQELFIELWQRRNPRPVHSVKAYLMQSLKFKLYKSFRTQRLTENIEQVNDEPFEMSHETFMILAQDDNEKAQRVLEAINQLPPRQKEVIYLKIYKGMNYDEVGEIMEINYQVVRNLLCQALKTFKKLLAPCILFISLYASAFQHL